MHQRKYIWQDYYLFDVSLDSKFEISSFELGKSTTDEDYLTIYL